MTNPSTPTVVQQDGAHDMSHSQVRVRVIQILYVNLSHVEVDSTANCGLAGGYLGLHLNPFGDMFHMFLPDPGWPVSPPVQEKVRNKDRIQKDIHIPQPDVLDIQRTPCHLGCLTLGCSGVNLYVSQHPNLCSSWVKFRDYNLTPLEETRLYLCFSKLLDCEGPNNSCVSKPLGLFWRWKKIYNSRPTEKQVAFNAWFPKHVLTFNKTPFQKKQRWRIQEVPQR